MRPTGPENRPFVGRGPSPGVLATSIVRNAGKLTEENGGGIMSKIRRPWPWYETRGRPAFQRPPISGKARRVNALAGGGDSGIVPLPAGRVAEWLKAPDSKSGVGATLPWVRIPPLPPFLLTEICDTTAKNVESPPKQRLLEAHTVAPAATDSFRSLGRLLGQRGLSGPE
jgi:hypothetical protein